MRSSSISKKCRSFSIFKKLRSSSIFKKMGSSSIFHLVGFKQCYKPKNSSIGWLEHNWGCLPFIKIEVIFHFQKYWVRLPFSKKMRSSSIKKKLRSSSIFKNIEVVFLISSIWVKVRLHTENQLPKLSRTALIVMGPSVWWWWSGFLTDNNTTPTKVVLNCFGLLVGLWQLLNLFILHRNARS